ncbi:hypothetical protein [Poseidonibacter ostreae]|uniref:Lipoprotein n=1 Tax=Poseidonibacter ostreae TaxID=2654171 RepID=A0A6L4WTG5_9BACT|nr:hypothetical protein [Poseidonibacter ostreae]KAB7889569.1 hypothetical protein GBG19_05800 [Poseidonibacter ostreae]
MLLNKFKTTILLSIATAIFTGCGYTPLPMQHFQKGDVIIEKNSDGTTRFFGISKNMEFASKYGITYNQTAKLISELKESAYYGKAKGYKYFAVKSDKFNNILGMPITSINSIMKYCSYPTSEVAKSHSGDCKGLSYRTDVHFFKENPNAFPVWNVDDVINEEIDLSYVENDKRKKALTNYLRDSSISFKN